MIYLDNAATTLQKPPAVAEAAARAIDSLVMRRAPLLRKGCSK